MGVIWEAEQVQLQRRVAVKLLRAGDEEHTRRFRRGAIVAAKMAHPNIVPVHDYGEVDGPEGPELYLVMERLSGVPLNRFMVTDTLPFEQSVSATSQTLLALEHVHRRGYIHRDVKPANLFVTAIDEDSFCLKLLDFGIARMADAPNVAEHIIAAERERAMRVTQPLRILGTPEYMAPEQILGESLDLRVDLYSAAIMLFHMLFGRLPFNGDRHELYQAHLREPVPALGQWLDCPDPDLEVWQRFFDKALAKRPEDRFLSATKMRAALRALPEVAVHLR